MAQVKGILCLIGGFMIQMAMSQFYTWANVGPYIISYTRIYSSPSDIEYGNSLWVQALISLSTGITMPLGGLLEKRIGTRLVATLGIIMCGCSLFSSIFTINVNYYLFAVTYGFLYGLAFGLAFAAPATLTMKWFPHNKGLVTGVMLSGLGIGGILINQFQTLYINPLNLEAVEFNNTSNDDRYFVDESILSKVPKSFLVFGTIEVVLMTFGVALLFPIADNSSDDDKCSYEKVQLLPTEKEKSTSQSVLSSTKFALNAAFAIGESAAVTQTTNSQTDKLSQSDASADMSPSSSTESLIETQTNEVLEDSTIYWHLNVSKAVQTRPYVTLWLFMLFNGLVMQGIVALYKTYAESMVVNDDRFLSTVASVASVADTAGRMVWGLLADKLSARVAMMGMCVCQTVLFSSLYLTHIFAADAGQTLLIIWVPLIYFSFSGGFAINLSTIASVFGGENSTILVGISYIALSTGGVLTIVLLSVVLPVVHYLGMFIICACFSATGFFLALTFDVRKLNGKYV